MPEQVAPASGNADQADQAGQGGGLARAFAAYTAARLGLLALVAAPLIVVGVPALVAVVIALTLSLSLSLVLFGGLRRRLATELDATRSRRAAERERLRAALRGDDQDGQADQADVHGQDGQMADPP